MPTPSGLLKAGDWIRHIRTKREFIVVSRTGNFEGYGVILETADGEPLPVASRHGAPNRMLMNTAHYKVYSSGDWELIDPKKIDLMKSVIAANPDIAPERVTRIVDLTLRLMKS